MPFLSFGKGQISVYDHLFKKYAGDIGWDWRLIASQAYNESHFDTTAVSWAGARGLMQLMPRTAAAFGVSPAGDNESGEEYKSCGKEYESAR